MKKIIKISLLVIFSFLIIAEIFVLIKADILTTISVAAGFDIGETTDVFAQIIPDSAVIFAPAEETILPEPQTETAIIEETAEIQTTDTTDTIKTNELTVPVISTQQPEIDAELIPKDVPILMYHTSSENNPGYYTELYVKPSEFEKQVKYLSENGFTFCTFDDYYNLNNISKPVFITFDDGYRENYTEIFPILKKYNAKITLFLIVNSITDSNITKDMVVEMSNSGLVKFESHSYSHPSLIAASKNDALLTSELRDSKTAIEEITGKPVVALCYPNGEFNDIVKEKTKEYYSFGVRKDLGMHNTSYDPFEVRRIRINRSTSLETFKSLVG